MDTQKIQEQIAALEKGMTLPGFWDDSQKAQQRIKELQELKDQLEGVGKYDKGNAVVSILAGAGGDDAEDFVGMLARMYRGYAEAKNWDVFILDESQNDLGGYRNLSFEVQGKGAYGQLIHEAGVHRLVRLSPFNAAGKRQTSFALVEVLPVIKEKESLNIPDDDLQIQFTKSSGAGGQNVNKRETAVRITHVPTSISVHVSSERSQQANREKALELLRGKLVRRLDEEQKEELRELSTAANTAIEWGNQIRSYVLHPYKMVKDHRTGVEITNPDGVLAGDLDRFIDAMKEVG